MTEKQQEKMLTELNWLKRWLVRQPRWLQMGFLLISGLLLGADLILVDPIPLIDEALLIWSTWTGFKVAVNDGPRYRRLEAPQEES
ncbi:MAG: hypothetical protein ABIH67_04750 [Candidatus Uhrbacteria bacterium]